MAADIDIPDLLAALSALPHSGAHPVQKHCDAELVWTHKQKSGGSNGFAIASAIGERSGDLI